MNAFHEFLKNQGWVGAEMGFSDETMVWLVPFLLGAISAIVWFVRIEGKVKYSEKTLDDVKINVTRLETKHDALDSKIIEKLSVMEKSLARIEGVMGARTKSKV